MTSLQDNDIVTCALKSNSPCVTNRNALSNSITIDADPGLSPSNFLPRDTSMCDFGNIELIPVGSFKTYLWSNGVATPTLLITEPGTYSLEITTTSDCVGKDTIIVRSKKCLKGFFLPTAFSPNGDGKNDVLRPYVGGRILHYQLAIFNRWGQLVFRSSDPLQGWDGKYREAVQTSEVFVWTCSYQLVGQAAKYEKGNVVVIR